MGRNLKKERGGSIHLHSCMHLLLNQRAYDLKLCRRRRRLVMGFFSSLFLKFYSFFW